MCRFQAALSILQIFLYSLQAKNALSAYAPKSQPNPGPSLLPYLTTTLVRPRDKMAASTYSPNIIFTKENNTEIIAQIGTTVVLHCAAENVGENTVSWIRKRDYHLLTVGTTAYSSDQRFQVRFLEDKNDWQLHIRYVQKHDEGVYECQVSSHPPVSLLAKINVVEASSEILGGPEKFLRAGSSLRLVCVLRKNTQPPSYVFWYLDNRMINYDERVKVETSGELSVLFLNNLGPESSGNYTCVPSNARPSTIHIQVLNGGETPAAIHSGCPRIAKIFGVETSLLLFSLVICVDLSNVSLSLSLILWDLISFHLFCSTLVKMLFKKAAKNFLPSFNLKNLHKNSKIILSLFIKESRHSDLNNL